MTEADRDSLKKLGQNEPYLAAVGKLWTASHVEERVPVERLPAGFSIPKAQQAYLLYDNKTHELSIRGPMSTGLRDELARDHLDDVAGGFHARREWQLRLELIFAGRHQYIRKVDPGRAYGDAHLPRRQRL